MSIKFADRKCVSPKKHSPPPSFKLNGCSLNGKSFSGAKRSFWTHGVSFKRVHIQRVGRSLDQISTIFWSIFHVTPLTHTDVYRITLNACVKRTRFNRRQPYVSTCQKCASKAIRNIFITSLWPSWICFEFQILWRYDHFWQSLNFVDKRVLRMALLSPTTWHRYG